MRHKMPMRLLILSVFGMVLCACRPGNVASETATLEPTVVQPETMDTPTPTHTPTGTPPPTATPTITRTRAPSSTPGPSPTPYPTPNYYASSLGDDFIFSGRSSDCELPCWQGLTPKESNTEDVQAMFDTVLGFNGTYDFFPEDATIDPEVPELVYTGHWWLFRQTEVADESFDIIVWADKDTRIVEAIRLMGWSDRFKPYANPQRILGELGAPSCILTPPIEPTQDRVWDSTALMFIYYEEGLVFVYSHIYVPIRYSNPQDYTGGVAELCLRSLPSTSLLFFKVKVYLTEPFKSELDALSPFQEFYLGTYMRDWPPIQDVWGVSPEELTQLAQEQWNVCLYTDVED